MCHMGLIGANLKCRFDALGPKLVSNVSNVCTKGSVKQYIQSKEVKSDSFATAGKTTVIEFVRCLISSDMPCSLMALLLLSSTFCCSCCCF